MTALPRSRFWSGPRLFALAAAAGVTILFVGANAHLITVAFASKPGCVLQPSTQGAAILRAAKPSC
jgi:hypothetical protein